MSNLNDDLWNLNKAMADLAVESFNAGLKSAVPTEVYREAQASDCTTEDMVKELHSRGVTIADIFGMYYALEEQESAKHDEIFGNDEEGQHGRENVLTVGDAELAGLAELPDKPVDRQPF